VSGVTILRQTPNPTHLVYRLFNLLPVGSALDELVDTEWNCQCVVSSGLQGRIRDDPLFRPKSPSVASHIPDDLRQVLCVADDVHVTQHLEVCKVVGDALLLERGDKGVIRIEVGNDLKASLEGDDLALEVALEDTTEA
jgi:hypothetical protein